MLFILAKNVHRKKVSAIFACQISISLSNTKTYRYTYKIITVIAGISLEKYDENIEDLSHVQTYCFNFYRISAKVGK